MVKSNTNNGHEMNASKKMIGAAFTAIQLAATRQHFATNHGAGRLPTKAAIFAACETVAEMLTLNPEECLTFNAHIGAVLALAEADQTVRDHILDGAKEMTLAAYAVA